jgi:hypothetical protein
VEDFLSTRGSFTVFFGAAGPVSWSLDPPFCLSLGPLDVFGEFFPVVSTSEFITGLVVRFENFTTLVLISGLLLCFSLFFIKTKFQVNVFLNFVRK